MSRSFLPFLLLSCGLAVTAVQAKPRTLPDRVQQVQGAELTLETNGAAVLSGIYLLEPATSGLSAGQAVEVKALPKDRYGRTPVILYLPGDTRSLQEHLLQQGKAVLYDRKAAAKAWQNIEAAHATIEEAQAAEHIGEFVVLRGTVKHTYKARDMYYINFGDDWKTDVSLRIPRKAWRSFGRDFAIADGTRLEARGVLFLENGPMLEITRPEQLEITHAHAQ